MTMHLVWGEGPAERIEIASSAELRRAVGRLAEGLERPLIASLSSLHGCDVLIGLTGGEAVVLVQTHGEPVSREWTTVGQSNRAGTTDYWYLGSHHTEWEDRNLLPLAEALDVLGRFYETGGRDSSVKWESNTF